MVIILISKVRVKRTRSGFTKYIDKQNYGISTDLLAINPNQCQKFGIKICNDPTDPHMNLGIEASEDLFIPMKMEVSTCGIVTHPPNDDEIHDREEIIL